MHSSDEDTGQEGCFDIPAQPRLHSHLIEGLYIDNMKFTLLTEGKAVSGTVKIKYLSTSGEFTQRTIDLVSILLRERVGYVLAHCHLRSELRTFKAQQIVEIIDAHTTYQQPRILPWLQHMPEQKNRANIERYLLELTNKKKPYQSRYDAAAAHILFQRLLTRNQDVFSNFGWLAKFEMPTFQLFKILNRGRVTKYAQIFLNFVEYDSLFQYLPDMSKVTTDLFPREKQWQVKSKALPETYFDSFEMAVATFMEQARSLSKNAA